MAEKASSYSAKAKAVAKFVTFKVTTKGKPSDSERNRVNKYHRLIYGYKTKDGEHIPGLYSGAKYAYKTKSEKMLRAAQDYGSPRHNKFLKVAFVPYDGIHKPKLRLRKGKIEDRQTFLTRRVIPFDRDLMADGLELDNVKEIVSEAINREPDLRSFTIMAGLEGNEASDDSADRSQIARMVAHFMTQYDGIRPQSGPDENHNYRNWLFGLIGYAYSEQKPYDEYREHRKAYAKMLRRDRRNAKRRK